MKHLHLTRPVVFFDLETTGLDPALDRIVEISVLKVEPDGTTDAKTRLINPERPIPPEATAIHGIRDEDVREAPAFRQVARSLLAFIGEADLAGYNVRRFDVPLLEREIRDAGLDLGLPRRRVLDAMTVFHKKEPRDLSAAVRFYLKREHEGAHGAEADVRAAAEILDAQLAAYDDLPRTVEALAAWCDPLTGAAADGQGKFLVREGRTVFNFGKHQGKPVERVAREEPGYLEWLLKQEVTEDVRRILREALGAPR